VHTQPACSCHFRSLLNLCACDATCHTLQTPTGAPTASRLSNIVLSYLRSQHRAACLSAAQPVGVLPPVSLLHPYKLPQARLPWEAPRNLSSRRWRQELLGPPGGRGEGTHWMAQLPDLVLNFMVGVCLHPYGPGAGAPLAYACVMCIITMAPAWTAGLTCVTP
jgi:hypothetical protein